jgi:YjbE family integral membrane protein
MNLLPDLALLGQILLIDLSLAGDNALAVGVAAAGLPEAERHRAVFGGIAFATVLRIVLALFAVRILHITGLLVAGGLLLLWVAWKMFRETRHARRMRAAKDAARRSKTLTQAILQIAVADISMSLDNVLAVAGVAREHLWLLAIGLAVSVLLMGAAASLVARWTERHPWIVYLGIADVLYTAVDMMAEGLQALGVR